MALDVPDGAIELRAQLLSDATRVCKTMDDHQHLLEEAASSATRQRAK